MSVHTFETNMLTYEDIEVIREEEAAVITDTKVIEESNPVDYKPLLVTFIVFIVLLMWFSCRDPPIV